MKILIVEDEIHIARHLAKSISDIIKTDDSKIDICLSIRDAMEYLNKRKIDLLFLDLNLRGKNGFDILKTLLAESFHVIVVSAHIERAIEAFEYGVLDFVPKPFTKDRLQRAFRRFHGGRDPYDSTIKYFVIKKRHRLVRVMEENVLYFEAYGHYSKMHLKDGQVEVYDKALVTLELLLGDTYKRVHKSYIVKMTAFESISVFQGGKYELVMINKDLIPVGRKHYKQLKKDWF